MNDEGKAEIWGAKTVEKQTNEETDDTCLQSE